MQSATLQDCFDRDYRQIHEDNGKIFLTKLQNSYGIYSYLIVTVNEKREIIDLIGLNNGQIFLGDKS